MIRKQDGTPYCVTGSAQQFDPEDPNLTLYDIWDQESIERGGIPVFYYEVFIQENTVDKLYLEDRGKIFSQVPVKLWCFYEPNSSQNYINQFGIDSPDEQLFELNYKNTLKVLGHPPKIGSRIYTPHLKENWVIIQRNLSEFKQWSAIRLQLIAQKFQESVTTGEGKVTQPKQDFDII
jgi:hypothetical protein